MHTLISLHRQVLSMCIVGTNTLSQELSVKGAIIPAFQSFFCYVLLGIFWIPITIYKHGWKGYGRMLKDHGWKCRE